VHRDIKPGNILLARRGRDLVAKVADFGLSKAFDRAGLSGMTLTGSVAGTMPFMARPQLIDYKHALPDVDVWSMAASLYWMLTGYYPRDFPEREDPIRVVLDTNAVPIRERDPNIPHRLATVIDEALIDRPKITVASAAQLAAALREAM
jgi:eukaryotic-like serine/threonine-protein kinase